jgi:membrane protein implicated in regulation of membrane protease activity
MHDVNQDASEGATRPGIRLIRRHRHVELRSCDAKAALSLKAKRLKWGSGKQDRRQGDFVVSTELIVYVGLMLTGLALLLLAFLGGGGSDVSGDVGGDMGHDIGGHDIGGHDMGIGDASGLSPLSLPMLAAFMGITGAVGASLTVGGTDSLWAAVFAIMTGVIGFAGIFIVVANLLVKSQASSLPHEKEYEGKVGTVIETITETGVGAIVITVRGMRQGVSARSDGHRIPINSQVLVKRVQDSVALVEQVSDKTD